MSEAEHVNEQEIIANLNYGASPEEVAESLSIPVAVVLKVQASMSSGAALTSDQVKEKLQKEYGNLELLAMQTILEVMNSPDSSSASRISAAEKIQNWSVGDGSTLDIPAWTNKLRKAAENAMPKNVHILDQAGDHSVEAPAPKKVLKGDDLVGAITELAS